MAEIIYVMGTARSGSTILEILLAANGGIFGAGELSHIFRDGFLDDVDCACGAPASACAVWGELRRRLGWPREEIEAMERLVRRIEAHWAFPLAALGAIPLVARRRYEAAQRAVFEGLAALTGAAAIVDSSKYAGRALALARAFPGQVRVIALTRSPTGLMAAFQKSNPDEQRPKSALAAMVYYLYVAACTRIALLLLGKRAIALRYERLTADPVGTLERIERWWGRDLSAARERLGKGEAFSVGHIVTGNRLRKAGRVRFQPREETPRVTGAAARLALGVMNLWRAVLGL